jgi:phosphoglycerate dehydrogenase-like enzyme
MNDIDRSIRIAVLDDYQGVALKLADWSAVKQRAEVTVFQDHVSTDKEVIERLKPFDVVCVMRERTPLTREIISALPKLKLISSTGPGNASIDLNAAADHGVEVRHTRYMSSPTIEFTWSLLLSAARDIPRQHLSLRNGGWQTSIGADLRGKTLGILGLGSVGSGVAKVGLAFGMNVIAWSQNLDSQTAEAQGVKRVTRDELFSMSDFLSIHVRMSERTKGLVGKAELALMKPDSFLINTSRAPIVDEEAIVDALTAERIARYAVDVFAEEPLPANHFFRESPRVFATPHIGYVSENLYKWFYIDTVQNVEQWIAGLSETDR